MIAHFHPLFSGAHTFGRAHCSTFVDRLYNFSNTGTLIQLSTQTYFQTLRAICPNGGAATNLTNFDQTTPDTFDKNYYTPIFRFRRACFRVIKSCFPRLVLTPLTL